MINRYENNEITQNGSYVKYEDYKLLEDKNRLFYTTLKTLALGRMTPQFIKEIIKDCTIKIRNIQDDRSSIEVKSDKLDNIFEIAKPEIIKEPDVIKVGSLVKSKKQKNNIVYEIVRLFVDLNTNRAEIKTVMVDNEEVEGNIHPNVPLDLLVLYKKTK